LHTSRTHRTQEAASWLFPDSASDSTISRSPSSQSSLITKGSVAPRTAASRVATSDPPPARQAIKPPNGAQDADSNHHRSDDDASGTSTGSTDGRVDHAPAQGLGPLSKLPSLAAWLRHLPPATETVHPPHTLDAKAATHRQIRTGLQLQTPDSHCITIPADNGIAHRLTRRASAVTLSPQAFNGQLSVLKARYAPKLMTADATQLRPGAASLSCEGSQFVESDKPERLAPPALYGPTHPPHSATGNPRLAVILEGFRSWIGKRSAAPHAAASAATLPNAHMAGLQGNLLAGSESAQSLT